MKRGAKPLPVQTPAPQGDIAAAMAGMRGKALALIAHAALLLIALPPRVMGLADFITTDEAYHWIGRVEGFSQAVAKGNWAGTILTGHPGVTIMWLGSLGLYLEQAALQNGWTVVASQAEHLAWLRLPSSLLEGLLVPLVYTLLRRLVTPSTALLAALLWATSPYLIAHSRLLHLDGLLTTFVTLSVLLALAATDAEQGAKEQRTKNKRTEEQGAEEQGAKNKRTEEQGAKEQGANSVFSVLCSSVPRYSVPLFSVLRSPVPLFSCSLFSVPRFSVLRSPVLPFSRSLFSCSLFSVPLFSVPLFFLIASGFFAGLALLTKGPALILLPSVGLLLLWRIPAAGLGQRLTRTIAGYGLWLVVAALVVLLLWPALWVAPGQAIGRYVEEITANGGRPNGDGQFFLGRAVDDPGPLFYLVANLFRATPVMLLGLIVSTGFAARDWGLKGRPLSQQNRTLLALAAFALLWTAAMTLGPKKFDRYVLPSWPALLILAAAGWGRLFDWLSEKRGVVHVGRRAVARWVSLLALAAVVLEPVQLWIYHPYYLSYYNPLLGGGATAQRVLLIGWGEGMDQVGAYLRSRPDHKQGAVLSALGRTLQFSVQVPVKDVTLLGDDPANYAVVYLESLQRGANPGTYAAIQQTVPLHKVTIHGIDYAQIYQLPRPFTQSVDAYFGEGLHLRGITIQQTDRLVITPSWDVRGPAGGDYKLFLHLLDSAGARLAQSDVAPGGDGPATSAWEPGQQLNPPLELQLPTSLAPGSYQLVAGLYDPASGARLPASGGTPADAATAGSDALLLATIVIR